MTICIQTVILSVSIFTSSNTYNGNISYDRSNENYRRNYSGRGSFNANANDNRVRGDYSNRGKGRFRGRDRKQDRRKGIIQVYQGQVQDAKVETDVMDVENMILLLKIIHTGMRKMESKHK